MISPAAHQGSVWSTRSRVVVLVDTPNIARSVERRYGHASRADYRVLHQIASSMGSITRACALVNDGVSDGFTRALRHIGFDVRRSHARDCDDALIAYAVRDYLLTDILFLCSGDRHYTRLLQILKITGVKVVLCSVEGSCSQQLRSNAHCYVEMPVKKATHNEVASSQK